MNEEMTATIIETNRRKGGGAGWRNTSFAHYPPPPPLVYRIAVVHLSTTEDLLFVCFCLLSFLAAEFQESSHHRCRQRRLSLFSLSLRREEGVGERVGGWERRKGGGGRGS
jgi:hypothetical protein